MKINLFLQIILFLICSKSFSQHIGMSIQDAEKKQIKIEQLEQNYKSAVATPPTESVFKPEELQEAYIKLLNDWGKFLSKNNFKWEKKTKCFQRIYFNNDGTIDYFIFNFLGKPEDKPSEEKQTEFNRLLNAFIQDYKFALTAKVKFAQCSPTTYTP
ncbi:MAG: hypothetical protein HY015_03050 [Bacteroidetes bacterium]|nr:hypothetical protein [Bacteroidota bacterium]MBI3481945.1 hypothetical protein [Bacteroidota bacterium]